MSCMSQDALKQAMHAALEEFKTLSPEECYEQLISHKDSATIAATIDELGIPASMVYSSLKNAERYSSVTVSKPIKPCTYNKCSSDTTKWVASEISGDEIESRAEETYLGTSSFGMIAA